MVDRMMIENSADELDNHPEIHSGRPCGSDGCTLCPFIYRGSLIVNRLIVTKPIIMTENWQCNSFSKRIYCIICLKTDCPHRGVVYYGKTSRMSGRLKGHVNHATAPIISSSSYQRVHKHFQGHDPLLHFRFALVQEEEDPDKQLRLESQYMEDFGTRGRFGFNTSRSKDNDEDEDVPVTTRTPVYTTSKYNPLSPRERHVNEFVLVALAIKNHKTERNNPQRNDQEATRHEITTFLKHYFDNDTNRIETTIQYLDRNAKANEKNWYHQNHWFTSRRPSGKQSTFVFKLNPARLQEIEDETLTEKDKMASQNC